MTLENTKLVGFWSRNFETYREIVVLVNYREQLTYFYVFFSVKSKQFTLLGRKDVASPKLNNKGLIIPDNYQKAVKFEENSRIIEKINQQFPETTNKHVKEMYMR